MNARRFFIIVSMLASIVSLAMSVRAFREKRVRGNAMRPDP